MPLINIFKKHPGIHTDLDSCIPTIYFITINYWGYSNEIRVHPDLKHSLIMRLNLNIYDKTSHFLCIPTFKI